MLFEIKYQRKSDASKRMFKTSVIVEGREFAAEAFKAQLENPDDYLIMFIRDISNDEITLEVKDISQKQKGKI